MFLFCIKLRCVHSYYHLVHLVCCYCFVVYLCVVPAGVTVLLGICNPPHRSHGESAKPGLLYPLVWIFGYDTIN
jgi:hypothetical protein